MLCRPQLVALTIAIVVSFPIRPDGALGCCPAPPSGKPVVNADQTVIILWDAKTNTQHFIRKATFKSAADDFGFLIPSPSEPELNESGNDAFPFIQQLTEPEVQTRPRPSRGFGCSCRRGELERSESAMPPAARVLQRKEVAGFDAVVLEADSAGALVGWLKRNEYAFSPEIQAWAKPYVEAGWKITALKVAKNKNDTSQRQVSASALRMTFKTERPLFPYREPDSKVSARMLNATQRLLRIYFIGEGRYDGQLTKDDAWTGKIAWANTLSDKQRKDILQKLKLPENAGPKEFYLTEFEDNWQYRVASADVYFSLDRDQTSIQRPPIIYYTSSTHIPTDVTLYAMCGLFIVPPILRRIRKRSATAKQH